MARYRGTVDGSKRGEYNSVQLRARFGKEELAQMRGKEVWPHSPFDDVDAYLCRAGVSLDSHADHDESEPDESCHSDSATYHYGGATVLVDYLEFTEGERHEGDLTVKIVSNDPVDDVIEQLCRRFPRLRKNEPHQYG